MITLKTSRFLTFATLGSILFGCSILPESLSDKSSESTMLTTEQRDELLDMLKSHKDNNESIRQWRQSQAGITRLLNIESDLKILIEQLNELSNEGSGGNDDLDMASQTSQLAQTDEKPQSEVIIQALDNKNEITSPPIYQTMPDNNKMLAGWTAIQLSAMKSQSSIKSLWQQLVKSHPMLLGDLSAVTEAVESSTGTIYRLKAGSFDNKRNASMLCDKLQKVGVSCLLTQYDESAMHLPIN